MLNISFTENDPKNSLVVHTETGRPLYEIDTPRSLGDGMTTIRRVDDKGVVAQVDWKSFGSDMLQFSGGASTKVGSFLSKEGTLSSSRVFVAPNGVEYKWKMEGNRCVMLDSQTREIAAESHRKKYGFFSGNSRPLNLDVTKEAVEFLDLVLLTFIIMEKKRRDLEMVIAANA